MGVDDGGRRVFVISFDGMVWWFKFECLFGYRLGGLCLFDDGENVRFSIISMIAIVVFDHFFDTIGKFRD